MAGSTLRMTPRTLAQEWQLINAINESLTGARFIAGSVTASSQLQGNYAIYMMGSGGRLWGNGGSASDNGLREISWGEAHALTGTEKHHPVFRYLLRAFEKAGFTGVRSPSGRMYQQKLLQLSTSEHRAVVHELWDMLNPALSRGLNGGAGGSDEIAQLIQSGHTTQTKVLESLKEFYRVVFKDDTVKLRHVLTEIDQVITRVGP